ncbi:TonB-dependent receptor [Parvularcula dongshanensis]|uniref:Outer membrane receptor protein involved in Fe transport n=1 Tax=Parvularcula dongshanensis TaxID=1173995 RepID=A0A840HZD8_9PROT|nr:TonB-dependent receptor [Parvularcula dongshanensis]MBB4657929.1 outer membrane receptor protein involved in Fe transport [Parvularcula dongshanensis]
MLLSFLLLQGAVAPDVIVVTGERRPASLAETPAAISVLTREEADLVLPQTSAELLNRVPGVLVQAGSGRESLVSVRSPVLTGGAGAGSFLYLADGVPLRAAGFANVNGLFDAPVPFAERVEVVRGPGDVAYGSNALHGAVNVITSAPGKEDGRARVSYGSFDRLSGLLEGGGERWRGGFSVLDDGGYRADQSALQMRAYGAVRIGEATLRLTAHHLEQETAGYVTGEGAYRDDAVRRSNPNPEAYRDARLVLASLEVPFEAGAWSGTVTPYARWTQMDFLQHFLPGDPLEENEHGSVGVQSTAGRPLTDDLRLLAGFDLDLTKGTLTETQAAPSFAVFPQGVHYDYAVKAVEAAPFARLSWDVLPQMTVQAGVRATFTGYDYDDRTGGGAVGRFLRPDDRKDDFSVVTAKLASTYDFGANGTIYASLARGARPPQTTDIYRLQTGQTPSGMEPETLDAAELGWRKTSERGSVSLAGFVMHKRHYFFRDADGLNVTDGQTDHIGVEAEGTLKLTDTLALSGAGTWAKHSYAFDRPVGDASESIADGDDVDTAPRTQGVMRLTWTPVPPLLFEAAWTHVGAYYTDAANTEDYPGHDLLDLRAQWRPAENLRLLGIVRNVTDERYADRADYAFGNARYFPGEERSAEVAVEVGF